MYIEERKNDKNSIKCTLIDEHGKLIRPQNFDLSTYIT